MLEFNFIRQQYNVKASKSLPLVIEAYVLLLN